MKNSVALWPRYHETKPRERTPVALIHHQIINSAGEILCQVESYEQLVRESIANQWDIYVGRIEDAETGFPFLSEALADGKAEISCLSGGRIAGIRMHGANNRTAWIGQSESWGYDRPTPDFLGTLDRLFAHCASGTRTTPGALGLALMSEAFWGAGWARQSRPTHALRAALLAHSLGGRVDTPALGEHLDECYEEDMRSAYLWAASQPLPIGTAVRFAALVPTSIQYATWYARCIVTVPRTYQWSPLMQRGLLQNEQVYQAGTYELWLWREEADEAVEIGITVDIRDGWGWEERAAMLGEWAERMHTLRNEAPDADIAGLVKISIVSAIGRHGMAPRRHTLVPIDRASEDAIPLLARSDRPHTTLFIEASDDDNASALTHWHSYIVMQVRLHLFRRVLLHAATGNRVLATDYDCIRLERTSVLQLRPDILGGFRQTRLTEVSFPHPRWVLSREKRRTPGVALCPTALPTA